MSSPWGEETTILACPSGSSEESLLHEAQSMTEREVRMMVVREYGFIDINIV